MARLNCRFYLQKFPSMGDVVMCRVRSIAEITAYADLLEYNNIEGMILLSELSISRNCSINKVIKIGRRECFAVIRVNKKKGYIDLSLRRACPRDVITFEEKFQKAKAVNSILRCVAEVLNYSTDEQLEELYRKTAWFFDKKADEQAIAYDVFKIALHYPQILDECGLDPFTRETLLAQIKRKFMTQTGKVKAGIDGVSNMLTAGISCSLEDMVFNLNFLAPLVYVVTKQTMNSEKGLQLLTTALEKNEESSKDGCGIFTMQQTPEVVTDIDVAELTKQLEGLKLDNSILSYDDDDSDANEGCEESDSEKTTTEDKH